MPRTDHRLPERLTRIVLPSLLVLLWTLGALTSCTTKKNEGVCCVSPEQCARLGIPDELRPCPAGQTCVAFGCEVASCSTDGCNANAPVCDIAANVCVGCVESSQCGRFPNSDICDVNSGMCVECISSLDCEGDLPICDAGKCRKCSHDDECASNVCDAPSGVCVPESRVLYASIDGSSTSACTASTPCLVARAIALADPQRDTIKLSSGVYTGNWTISGKRMTIHGIDATLQGNGSVIIIGAAADVRIRETTIVQTGTGDPAVLCYAMGSPSSLELDGVTVSAIRAIGTGGDTIGCNVAIRRSKILLLPNPYNGSPVFFSQSLVTIEQTLFNGTGFGSSEGMAVANGSQLKMTNSIFANQGSDPAAGSLSRSLYSGAILSFNTFYRSHIVCESAVPSDCSQAFCFDNNIFLDGQTSTTSDSVQGSGCVHDHNIAFPQLSSLNGVGNQININPRLADPAGGDFRLRSDSPAIDAATPGVSVSKDFAGALRPYGSGADIGALEYRP